MKYETLPHIQRVKFFLRPGVVAATSWDFSLYLDKHMVAVVRQCCGELQQGLTPVTDGRDECSSCSTPLNVHQDNRRMVLWRELSMDHVNRWLDKAGVDPFTVMLAREDLADDLRSWLWRRAANQVPQFSTFFRR